MCSSVLMWVLAVTVSLWCVKPLRRWCHYALRHLNDCHYGQTPGCPDHPSVLPYRCFSRVAFPLSCINPKPAQCSGESRPPKQFASNSRKNGVSLGRILTLIWSEGLLLQFRVIHQVRPCCVLLKWQHLTIKQQILKSNLLFSPPMSVCVRDARSTLNL